MFKFLLQHFIKINSLYRVKLDGINLHLTASSKQYLPDFIQAMRQLMDNNDDTKKYYLTASPDCYTLDIPAAFLYDVLTKQTDSFDALYVNFASTNCYLTNKQFGTYFAKWSNLVEGKSRPAVYLTLSAGQRNFVSPEDVQHALNVSLKMPILIYFYY